MEMILNTGKLYTVSILMSSPSIEVTKSPSNNLSSRTLIHSEVTSDDDVFGYEDDMMEATIEDFMSDPICCYRI